jgi:RNA polymerase sigma-70 factor (ECF subfamily)
MDEDNRARGEALYRENIRPLLAYALTRTGRENAHDVVSSTFLVAWRRLDDVPEDALPWLIGVARRVLADQWRSEARRTALGQRLGDDTATSYSSIDDVAESMVLRGSIRDALTKLRPKDREVIMLVAWQGFSTEQLAVALGCSKALASLRLHRARRRFAKVLENPHNTPAHLSQQLIRPAKEVP